MREYLKKMRKDLHRTQCDIASKMGIVGSAYTMIENGTRQKNMDFRTMCRLAEVFDVPIEYIVQQEQQLHR